MQLSPKSQSNSGPLKKSQVFQGGLRGSLQNVAPGFLDTAKTLATVKTGFPQDFNWPGGLSGFTMSALFEGVNSPNP